jgi:meiosis induction protein kinase IME2/SME1
MTSAQCIEHPYFRETLPHLQQTPPLPRIPFSQGQPQPGAIPPPVAELTAPPRAIPPSHSHHDSRPAFANGDMRTLPPPIGTPDTNNSNRVNFPGPYNNRYETSALVSQLRELDLPTEDLHSYGHRPAPSPRGQPAVYQMDEDPSTASANQRTRQWAEETGRRGSNAHSTMYDGSNFEGSEAAASNASFSQFNLSSQAGLPPMRSNTKVASYVQAQQQIQVYEDGTPRQPLNSPSSLSVQSAAPSKSTVSVPSKKKKWGMSSIFGGGDKSTSTLAPVEEVRYTGSSSGLKRTQSGNDPSQRGLTMTPGPELVPVAAAPASLDPKQAKKEAEKAKREAEKIKRETAARMQKERARAVMMKRQNIEQQQPAGHDIEYAGGYGSTKSAMHQPDPAQRAGDRGGIYVPAGSNNMPAPSPRPLRDVAQMPATQSMSSIQSRHSDAAQSHWSGYSGGTHQSQSQPQLPMARLDEMPGRHKARRRDVDDDHSMSSFDHQSLKSRSVLTVGTVDSE